MFLKKSLGWTAAFATALALTACSGGAKKEEAKPADAKPAAECSLAQRPRLAPHVSRAAGVEDDGGFRACRSSTATASGRVVGNAPAPSV